MKNSGYFKGYYFKHQKDEKTIAFIVGATQYKRFIQVITNNGSYQVPRIGRNSFTAQGIKINIHEPEITILGSIRYGALTPIKYDIMGPFKYFPMECRHGVISMYHKLYGTLLINGESINFTGGTGYIEMDSGTSFPKSYLWFHSNDFCEKASIMFSIADIPFFGTRFQGCICVIWYQGKEYRLATYHGVNVIDCNENQVILSQRNLLLIVDLMPSKVAHSLYAPNMGIMSRTIRESLSCKARIRFYRNKQLVFDMQSQNCSFEFVKPKS